MTATSRSRAARSTCTARASCGRRRCIERIRVTNFRLNRIEVPLAIRFDADFADVFEVRGTQPRQKGRTAAGRRTATTTSCAIAGSTSASAASRVRWSRPPDKVDAGRAAFLLRLEPKETATIVMSVAYETDAAAAGLRCRSPRRSTTRCPATSARRADAERRRAAACSARAPMFNRWLDRSTADLQIMLTDTPHGVVSVCRHPVVQHAVRPRRTDHRVRALVGQSRRSPAACWRFSPRRRRPRYNDAQDAQPGKILHEMRGGEMAALGEVPFGRYYGSCDATPLFVMLAHAYYQRTGDREFIDRIWPNIVRRARVDANERRSRRGRLHRLRAEDRRRADQPGMEGLARFHLPQPTARRAEGPIALCEVQGYAYAAWNGAAQLAALRGDTRAVDEWSARAERLRERFELAFWCEDLDTYALALDGRRRPCRVRTSNPGHCLFAGIVTPERAKRVCDTLMSDASFNGWGVRTVAAGERRYNPQSYHNGSIWPHDNALIAAGASRYGFTGAATRILNATLELSEAVDLHRLPELICGFTRRGREPTLYPVACAPQAWAAGAVFLMLAASLGMQIDAPARRISFSRGRLPESIDWIRLTDLKVGDAQRRSAARAAPARSRRHHHSSRR